MNLLVVWTKNTTCWEILRKFSKSFKKFLKKIANKLIKFSMYLNTDDAIDLKYFLYAVRKRIWGILFKCNTNVGLDLLQSTCKHQSKI